MEKWKYIRVIAAFLFVMSFVAGCGTSPQPAPTSPPAPTDASQCPTVTIMSMSAVMNCDNGYMIKLLSYSLVGTNEQIRPDSLARAYLYVPQKDGTTELRVFFGPAKKQGNAIVSTVIICGGVHIKLSNMVTNPVQISSDNQTLPCHVLN